MQDPSSTDLRPYWLRLLVAADARGDVKAAAIVRAMKSDAELAPAIEAMEGQEVRKITVSYEIRQQFTSRWRKPC